MSRADRSSQQLFEFLSSLPKGRFTGGRLQTDAVPTLVSLLGMDPEDLRFEFPLIVTQHRIRIADAAVVTSQGRAFLALEVMSAPPALWEDSWLGNLKESLLTSATPLGILLTHGHLAWVGPKIGERVVPLSKLEPRDGDQIQEALEGAIAEARAEVETPPDAGRLDPDCSSHLRRVQEASTNNEKKESLEDFAAWLIKSTKGLRLKHRNLRTSSSELDLVVEVASGSIADSRLDCGRHFVLECKNWAKPVGAREVRDFAGKLIKVGTKLGLMISRNGVTGKHGAEDALREIRFCYDHLQIAICVLSEEDLLQICRDRRFIDIVDLRLDRLRFDMAE